MSQAYYSPEIIKLTSLLVSGVDHSAHHRRVAARRRAVYLKAVSAASSRGGVHINSISDNEDAILGSSLYQISLPAEFALKPYGTLMEYLTGKNILPLGLLREVVEENCMPFVFTTSNHSSRWRLEPAADSRPSRSRRLRELSRHTQAATVLSPMNSPCSAVMEATPTVWAVAVLWTDDTLTVARPCLLLVVARPADRGLAAVVDCCPVLASIMRPLSQASLWRTKSLSVMSTMSPTHMSPKQILS